MLLLVAGVNVMTTLLFAVRERYREIGVLKAIGLTPRELLMMVPVGACLLALIGAVVGIPAGLVITEQLFDYFGQNEGWKKGVAVLPAWWQLVLLLPVGLAVAAVGSLLPARRAASMPVTQALQWE
jgi:putative ABC transport system permease protein